MPFVYRAQLAIYRTILAPLYPGHAFRCLLIYTEKPAVLTITEEMLDASLVELSKK